jgi:hypothetical protein
VQGADGETAGAPAWCCRCGAQPQPGWLVMAEPRLLPEPVEVVPFAVLSSWLRFESDRADRIRPKPATPPPRSEPV